MEQVNGWNGKVIRPPARFLPRLVEILWELSARRKRSSSCLGSLLSDALGHLFFEKTIKRCSSQTASNPLLSKTLIILVVFLRLACVRVRVQ